MVIFVSVSAFPDYILYFASPMCRTVFSEVSKESLLSIKSLPLISVLPEMIVSNKCSSFRRTILESPTQFFFPKVECSVLFDMGEN